MVFVGADSSGEVHCFDCLILHLRCEVMDPCFIHSNESTQKFVWITLKHCFEIVTRLRLRSTMSKRGTHLADSFFIFNCLCKIEFTVPCDMLVVSTSLRTFIRQSIKTISWPLSMIFGIFSLNCDVLNEVITCGCTTMFKFIHLIVYSRKCWCRCAMNIIQLGFFRR